MCLLLGDVVDCGWMLLLLCGVVGFVAVWRGSWLLLVVVAVICCWPSLLLDVVFCRVLLFFLLGVLLLSQCEIVVHC